MVTKFVHVWLVVVVAAGLLFNHRERDSLQGRTIEGPVKGIAAEQYGSGFKTPSQTFFRSVAYAMGLVPELAIGFSLLVIPCDRSTKFTVWSSF